MESGKTILKNVDDFHDPTPGEDSIATFNAWALKNGVIMPKLKYPGYFEGGLCGVLCQAEI